MDGGLGRGRCGRGLAGGDLSLASLSSTHAVIPSALVVLAIGTDRSLDFHLGRHPRGQADEHRCELGEWRWSAGGSGSGEATA